MPENLSEPLPQIHIPGVSGTVSQEERTVVHHVFILDASGSMAHLQRQTIVGFNEQVQNIRQLEQQFPNQRNLVTLVVFNGTTDVRFFDTDSVSLQQITEADYQPDGSTRLYGSVGDTLTRLRDTLGDRCSTERVFITIMTDGADNVRDNTWTQNTTAEFIQQVQKQYHWVVTFVGANIDVAHAAQQLNIPISNTVAYTASEAGTLRAFNAVSEGRTMYMARARSSGAGGQCVATDAIFSADLSRGLDLRDDEDALDVVAGSGTVPRRRLTPEQRTRLTNLVRTPTPPVPTGP
ncbi:VWA domain-containing protein [Candidatus Dependentiae bacterium]|nr:MAG: VWA domain-containing protein [Candidatus Dependentiae bacterium]